MSKIGYCCICLGINEGVKKVDQVSVNRGMVKKTFDTKGLEGVSELATKNLEDLIKILEYNLQNNIFVYRMSSEMFPWLTHYDVTTLPRFDRIKALLKSAGDFAKLHGMRLSFHAPPFCVLASQNPDVVEKTIDELDKHSQLMDLMGLEASTYYSINVHVGVTKPSREEAAERFCQNFERLSATTKKRLTVENDDSKNQFSTQMLKSMIWDKIGTPIVFDFFHHACFSDDLDQRSAFELARQTWQEKQLCHHSSSRKIHEDQSSKLEAHADYLFENFDDYGYDIDVELECKAKDLALLKFRSEFMAS
jgi:UV DNA damage endonuclease